MKTNRSKRRTTPSAVRELSSRELQIELLRRAIERGKRVTAEMVKALAIQRRKQLGRYIELARQKAVES